MEAGRSQAQEDENKGERIEMEEQGEERARVRKMGGMVEEVGF